MTEPLSREQIVKLVEIFVGVDGEVFAYDLLTHDAALRAQLAQKEQACQHWIAKELDARNKLRVANDALDAAKQQLAQQDRVRLECGHSNRWYAVDDDANDDCLGCRTIHLEQQLAACQADLIEARTELKARSQ
jgi:hypothetical protein